MERRNLLKAIAAAPLAAFAGRALTAPPATMKEVENLQNNWKMLLAEGTPVPAATDKLTLSKDEWRKRLDAQAYNVLREEGTERAGASPLDREKREGVFVCAGCGLPGGCALPEEQHQRKRGHHDDQQVEHVLRRVSDYPAAD
jgi:peptide-methionine (R)-S-oxide reductase